MGNRRLDFMRSIDGTGGTKQAPRPRRGWTRALYDVCEANSGWSTEEQITQLLPAAIDTNMLIPHSKLEKYLYSAVYMGYLIENDGRWNVAPFAYYESRQKAMKAAKGTKGPRKLRRDKRTSTVGYAPRPLWHWHFMATVFMCGFVIGALVVLSVGS